MQLVLGAAGAVVGTLTGVGPQIGWAVGSTLGSMLSRPDKQVNAQPIMDLRIPGTQDGRPIPWIRGAARIAPDWIWHTDRRPITTSSTSGGKAGGGPEVENQSTTYEMDALLMLTVNGGVGVLEIYERGELIYRADPAAPPATVAASIASERWDRMTVYDGNPSQMPDPDYEAWVDANVGAGLAPAYRGRMTVFIKGLKLGQSGQVPQLEFVPVVDGSYEDGGDWQIQHAASTADWTALVYGGDQFIAVAENSSSAQISPDGETWTLVDLGYSKDWESITYGAGRYVAIGSSGASDNVAYSSNGIDWTISDLPENQMWDVAYGDGRFVAVGSNGKSAHSDNGISWSVADDGTGNTWRGVTYSPDLELFVAVASTGTGNRVKVSTDGVVWSVGTSPADNNWQSVTWGDGLLVAVASSGTGNRVMTSPDGLAWTLRTSANDYTWNDVHYADGLYVAVGAVSLTNDGVMTSADGITWVAETPAIYERDWQSVAFGNGTWVAVANNGVNDQRVMTRGALPVVAIECPTVADVQGAIFERAGLESAQYTVSSLSTITRDVCCLPWAQISAPRVPTELMMATYFYEITASGSKIKAVPRGGSEAATIPFDDLGAREPGSGGDDDPLPLRTVNDLESPALGALNYINLANNYQQGSEGSDRLMSASAVTIQPVEMAIGMQPAEAKGVIDTMVRDRASAVLAGRIALLRSDYPRLEPTDPIILTGRDGSQYRTRIVRMTESFPLISLDVVLDDPNALSDQGITSVDYDSQTEVLAAIRTSIELLDPPMLRETDNDIGAWVVAKGDREPFPGAAIFKSSNDVDFTRAATIEEPAIFGRCASVLGDWSGPRVFDETNSVLVNVGDDELTSSTRANVLANREVNAYMIGSECGQFIEADLVSSDPNIYRVRRLLRGSLGTEWAMTGHVSGERFILLRPAGMRRIALDNSELGATRYYKGVTFGRPLSSASSQPFAAMGINLKPYAPVLLRVTRDGSNNATLSCERRSRFPTRVVGDLGISIPLGEASEAYEWDVFDDNTYTTVVRTLTSITPTVAYSAAQQTSDGLTPGDPLHVRVYQMSAMIGRGYPLERAA